MAPPTHPLRRISTGSLTSLARSQDHATHSSSGLDFLQPALTDLADEAATLASNIQRMTRLHDALGTFNEAFAAYLYAMKMNAFCVEWAEAPTAMSFERAATLVPPPANPPTPARVPAPASQPGYGDTTYATVYSSAAMDDSPPPVRAAAAGRGRGRGGPAAGGRGGGAVGRGGKRVGVTAGEKRKRDLAIAAIIDTMPLEYRGSSPAASLLMEKVLLELMAHPEGRKLSDLVAPPERTQAKVNKCLIALVSKRVVDKTAVGGVATYRLV